MTKKPETTPEEARAILDEERKARAEAYWAYIQDGGERFRCILTGVPEFVPLPDGRFVVNVRLVVHAQE